MQKQAAIPQKDFQKWMLERGAKFFTAVNTQTGNSFIYKLEWAEYDVMAPDANMEPPIYVSLLIAQTERFAEVEHPTCLTVSKVKLPGVINETIYMGAIYDRNEYIHYDKYLPTSYPACKIWNFLWKNIRAGKEIAHIELYEGLPTTEGMDMEAVLNLQYGAFFPIERLGAVSVATGAVRDFCKVRKGLELFNHQRALISKAVQNSEN